MSALYPYLAGAIAGFLLVVGTSICISQYTDVPLSFIFLGAPQ